MDPMGFVGAVAFPRFYGKIFQFFENLNPAPIEGIDALFTEGVVPLDASIGAKIGFFPAKPGGALGDVREILAYFR